MRLIFTRDKGLYTENGLFFRLFNNCRFKGLCYVNNMPITKEYSILARESLVIEYLQFRILIEVNKVSPYI